MISFLDLLPNDHLVQIDLVQNINGSDVVNIPIGVIISDPFVILTEWLTKYFICQYEGEQLYPMSYVGYKYAIGIKTIFKPNSSQDIITTDIDLFESTNSLLRLGKIENNESNSNSFNMEYFDRLRAIKDTYPVIQDAINLNYIVSDVENKSINELCDLLKQTIYDSETSFTINDCRYTNLYIRAINKILRLIKNQKGYQ